MDRLTVNDAAQVVRELREKGLAERSIGGVIAVANRISSSPPAVWPGTA